MTQGHQQLNFGQKWKSADGLAMSAVRWRLSAHGFRKLKIFFPVTSYGYMDE